MLEDRNIKYPSYALAAILAYVAFLDASHGLTLGQAPDASAAWFIELLTAGICAALATLMLTRPHLWFFAAAAGWSLLAFLANFIMKAKDTIDTIATERMTFYFIVLVGAGILAGIEGWKFYQTEKAKRPQNPWGAGPWPGQYPGAPGQPPQQYPAPQQQFAPPPAPPQAPPPPPPPPAAPQK